MIVSFRHKGLKRFYEDDDPRRLPPDMVPRIRAILSALDVAIDPAEMDLPSFRLHALKGDLRGFWAVTVRANWRIVFRFDGRNAVDIDFLDYH
ncbi:MAG: type II toxin-antitoxin system RelE/ParE family toxin [Alphaproteobacteria bacterium]|nr:type II toxin-antitoxin system RelE/ParE family toxin [Alphaproteobacteria bacterium]MCA0451547.1 type II toxin-antitoxin system RelE/ParE family toxin [Pseudomonadota bacterium]